MSFMRLASQRVPHLAFVLATVAFVISSVSAQQLSNDDQTCVLARDEPSCFFGKAPTGKNKKLVVFVHGIFGSAAATWGNPKKDTFWPAMVANDTRFSEYDIYLVNYRAPYLAGAPNVHETAGNELGKLFSRNIFERYDEIYFIAHSMGGLVAKSMLGACPSNPVLLCGQTYGNMVFRAHEQTI